MTLVKTSTYIVIQQATHANTEDAPTRIILQGEYKDPFQPATLSIDTLLI